MKKKLLLALGVSLLIAAFLAPFASSKPDGLERVAEDTGFINRAKTVITSPIPEYLFPGIKHEGVATGVAGVLGTLVSFGVMYGLAKLVAKPNRSNQQ